ncbi:bifunctional riboflavin kinase/FAD synthetase [Derxia lacustris]|uniref:bifunctional riboflavin kinase/FAD synthetase n=1 Tax=Derxia lacustris TaxID=764842 RepID=UPI000A176C15|nr:bifunctional riboflavin kinase/FAD synthetase [Derxia lacustris]
MRVFRGLPTPESRSPCVLTIGNFDGVHRGHRALLARAVAGAHAHGLPAAVMTFEPHPREYFAQLAGDITRAPARIANLRDKLEGLRQCGVDRVIVEHFGSHFAALTAAQFVEEVLVGACHVKHVIVGDDFCFGAGRKGDFATLLAAGREHGFTVESMPTVADADGGRVSSSAVRDAIEHGDFARCAELLGHPYTISGKVIHGRKLGRTIGFPTLNVRISHRRPCTTGIFVVRVHGLDGGPHRGVASLGVRPTVEDNGRVLLEAHVFDWAGDAYGKLVRIEFLKKLRNEAKYDSLPALTAAIDNDAQQARAFFAAEAVAAAHAAPPAGSASTGDDIGI